MPRPREEIQIFSLSFLDLLFCSLAAVVILWVLLDKPALKEPVVRFAFAQIRQRGVWHLAGLEVHPDDGSPVFSTRAIRGTAPLAGKLLDNNEFRKQAEASLGLLATFRDGDKEFAGQVLLACTEQSKPAAVRAIFEMCPNKTELHTILVELESHDGMSQYEFCFTKDVAFKSAVTIKAAAAGSPQEFYLARPTTGSLLELTLTVSEGTISFTPPIVDPIFP